MKKIVLFYKKLIEPGGAERLLVNEYINFKKLGYEVDIVGFEINNDALFGENIDNKNIVELSSNRWFGSLYRLIKYISKNKEALFLCASGHIEMYIASLFLNYEYSLHIHHPSFMSFNETDKYSIFQRKHFKYMLKSNFGASRFEAIYNKLSFLKKVYINLRAILSIAAIKKSKNNFVLSNYAKNEKKILFGIDSQVLCGALNESVFDYKLHKDFSDYSPYKFRILTIARLDENKRIDELIRAFQIFLEIEPNSILLIGGRGPEMNDLQLIANELQLTKNIQFLGFIPDEDLMDWYHMADLFVSIDWADYRITMYESLAMNTKVLLSDETDADEFLMTSKYLYLSKPDYQSCVQVMKMALNEKPTASYDELKQYLSNFTWSNYCKNLAKVLDTKC